MRVLAIPFDVRPGSNEVFPGRIRLLARLNELRGVPRAQPFTRGLGGFGAYIKYVFYVLKVLLYGLRRKHEYDVIFCHDSAYTPVGGILGFLLRKPCVRDCTDVAQKWISRVKAPRGLTVACLAAEKISRRLATINVVLSEADKQFYVKDGIENRRIRVLPLTVDVALADRIDRSAARARVRQQLGVPDETGLIIFTGGSRDYPPNMWAVQWILNELIPALQTRGCSFHVVITGSGKIPANHPRVAFVGFVSDILEYIAAADIAIVPQEMEAGMSTKTLDAMVCSVPVVATSSIARGIPQLRDGDNAMLAKNKDDFLEKTIYLLEHPQEASRIGAEGRKTVAECYDWRAWEGRMQAILQVSLETRFPGPTNEKVSSSE